MKSIQDFTDLEVWQKAQILKVQAYDIARKLPSSEKHNLSLQIRKCAISITANIAEGFGRFHTNDTMQFIRISRGSLFELKNHILSCKILNLIPSDDSKTVLNQINLVGRLLNGYLRYLRKFSQK